MQFFTAEGMRYVMGTLLRLSIQGTSQDAGEQAKEAALRTVQMLEEKLSIHRPDSEISQINRNILEEAAASQDTRKALSEARRLKDATGRMFDPFMEKRWDLGAFGKGFALDQALDRVAEFPAVFACRFDFGGQLLFWDREDHVSEVVVIELPGFETHRPEFMMKRQGSVSTSAHFERGAHIQDPRTAKPLATARSVTVIAPRAAVADAWSTALFVMGPEIGLQKLSEHPDLAALFVEFKGNTPVLLPSVHWPATSGAKAGIGTIHRPLL